MKNISRICSLNIGLLLSDNYDVSNSSAESLLIEVDGYVHELNIKHAKTTAMCMLMRDQYFRSCCIPDN